MATTESNVSAATAPVRRLRDRVPGPARRVRLPWLAAAVGAALVAAALVLWGFGRASERREVVVVNAAVAEGQPIPAEALGTTFVAIDSSATRLFSASQRDDLVGRVAAADLAPGDLLGPSLIAVAPVVPDGWQEVGGLLRVGRYPGSLTVGDRLRAVPLEGAEAPVEVLVAASSVGDDRALTLVLAVPAESAATVAQWAATDNLVLVRVGS